MNFAIHDYELDNALRGKLGYRLGYSIEDVLNSYVAIYPNASIYYEEDYEAEEDDIVYAWSSDCLTGQTVDGLFFGIDTGENDEEV